MDRIVAGSSDVDALGAFPERIIEMNREEMNAIPLADQAAIQLQGARRRFHELRARIPMLARLAEEQSIADIRSIEDLAPLLIPHSALKSYPMSYLEKSQFDRLTQWLDGFTTHDLSHLDAKACDSIDDWLDLLDAKTDVRVMHSTGTTGKLSFLPRGTLEMHRMVTVWASKFREYRDEVPLIDRPIEETPVLYTSYRRGAMAYHRLLDYLQSDLYGGDPSRVLAANPGRLSADAASIGGRLRVRRIAWRTWQDTHLAEIAGAPRPVHRRSAERPRDRGQVPRRYRRALSWPDSRRYRLGAHDPSYSGRGAEPRLSAIVLTAQLFAAWRWNEGPSTARRLV